jgi:pimeloyl-ACP methyl ester carboxylesterase
MQVQANGMTLEVEDTGETDRFPVLLVAGMGMQLIGWPPPFVRGIQRSGFRVIRFDNRDIGLSTSLDHLGKPSVLLSVLKQKVGLKLNPPYTVQDLADDALALMDAMQLPRAHVVGVSMGSMVAQRMALSAPDRLISLTLLMTSSGAPNLPGPTAEVLKAMMVPLAEGGTPQSKANTLRFLTALASPGFPYPSGVLEDFIDQCMARSDRPQGALRQAMAVAADTERANALGQIRTPTLVIHGREDPILPWPCGLDAAQRIPFSEWQLIEGMGHDFPPGVVTQLLAHLLPFMHQHS